MQNCDFIVLLFGSMADSSRHSGFTSRYESRRVQKPICSPISILLGVEPVSVLTRHSQACVVILLHSHFLETRQWLSLAGYRRLGCRVLNLYMTI